MPPTSQDCDSKSNTASSVFNTLLDGESTETHRLVSLGDFQDKTLRLLKMAREALIYLSLAMHREEALRRGSA